MVPGFLVIDDSSWIHHDLVQGVFLVRVGLGEKRLLSHSGLPLPTATRPFMGYFMIWELFFRKSHGDQTSTDFASPRWPFILDSLVNPVEYTMLDMP